MIFPKFNPNRIAVKLSVVGERNLKQAHPWIFSDSILKVNKEGCSGDIAIIFSHKKNTVLGIGLYDPDSPIRIKMLHNGGGATINKDFFLEKITKAYALRIPLLETNTNSYRLIFGENDGFPGFIADVYSKVMVVKLYSAIWFPYLETIITLLTEVISCKCIVLRLSRALQQKSETHGFKEGQIIYGNLDQEEVSFVEHGVHFSANVIKGHKTGYFLDHRNNRKRVGEFANGKTVLDIFSYAGGFSVHALANGAKKVTSVDISKQALELAAKNAKLNSFSGEHITLAGDAFEIMEQLILTNKQFEVVVIDPPSFAKSKNEIEIAKKKYRDLAQLGAKLTANGGLLVLASCSSRVLASEFFSINEQVLQNQSRMFKVLDTSQHDIDHPITFKEGAYLKTGYYRFIN
jgi:23S rRNA (cytosine1962-C5)-methyltransferase